MNFFAFLLSLFFSIIAFSQELKIQCSEKSEFKSFSIGNYSFENRPLTAKEKEDLLKKLRAKQADLCKTTKSCFSNADKTGVSGKELSDLADIISYADDVSNRAHKMDSAEIEKHIAHLEYYNTLCEKTSGTSVPGIKINYNDKGLNKGKSGTFDKEQLDQLIETSIKEGVDPYLSIAILLLENPPSTDAKSNMYKRMYGLLPIDAVAAYDILGCSVKKEDFEIIKDKKVLNKFVSMYEQIQKTSNDGNSDEYYKKMNALSNEVAQYIKDPKDSDIVYTQMMCEIAKKDPKVNKCSGYLGEQKKPFPIDMTYSKRGGFYDNQWLLCSQDKVFTAGAAPGFQLASGGSAAGCCVDVKTHRMSDEAYSEVLGALGVKYLKRTVQDCASKGQPLDFCVQKYNGLGCFNCTEKMANDCFNGIVMEDRPVYGNRGLDLMVKSIMNNPEINALITENSNRLKSKPMSIFCSGKTGPVSINTDQFLNNEKKFLLQGENQFYKFPVKTSAGPRSKPAETAEEKELYLKLEANRKKACLKYYN